MNSTAKAYIKPVIVTPSPASLLIDKKLVCRKSFAREYFTLLGEFQNIIARLERYRESCCIDDPVLNRIIADSENESRKASRAFEGK